MIFDIAGVEKEIGYSFKDKMLLRKCFTHSSYANEKKEEDNEVLEFFGDAVIEFIVTEYLVKSYKADEGKLTDKRKELVSNKSILKTAKKLKLGEFMLIGKGLMGTLNGEAKMFSSVYEALVAGIYIDGGLKKAKDFIFDTLIKDYAEEDKNKTEDKDAKSRLQEFIQKTKIGSISYEILSKDGPDNAPVFKVAVMLNGTVLAVGTGSSKKKAETVSAESALKVLNKIKKTNCNRR